MFDSDHILTLDVGASKLVLAEFSLRSNRVPELLKYGIGDLGVESDTETDPAPYIVATLRDLMKTHGMRPAPLLLTISGQSVFPRYVKLPHVARDKIKQMIQYEAEQNVPFPISEVIWDYQLIGADDEAEQDVLLVAAKKESVTELTDCVAAVGLEPDIVDVAPMALYNCLRYNYPDIEGCTMVLDIGARSTNLLFAEEHRIFTRSIPVAGNTITQEIAKSFQLSFREAEALKREHAVVALGGVYSSGDSEIAERISKVVRNVVTRLHAEVNRSINFYRSQQGGSPPSQMFLTGGSSVIPHMDTFFREKLRVEVDYLNPFVNVLVSDTIDVDASADSLFLLGEVVGLALRRGLSCPVEVNLLPPEIVGRKTFRRRLPYFGLAAVGVVLTMVTWALHAGQMRRIYEAQQQSVEGEAQRLRRVRNALQEVIGEQDGIQRKVEALRSASVSRTAWGRMLEALRESLFEGMWLLSIEPVRDAQGRLTHLRVTGKGFEDALAKVPTEVDGRTMTVVELLRDRIDSKPLFRDTQIENERPLEVYLREFVLLIGVEDSVGVELKPR